jgi:hypothetical protein
LSFVLQFPHKPAHEQIVIAIQGYTGYWRISFEEKIHKKKGKRRGKCERKR